jgi:hypothetical protein
MRIAKASYFDDPPVVPTFSQEDFDAAVVWMKNRLLATLGAGDVSSEFVYDDEKVILMNDNTWAADKHMTGDDFDRAFAQAVLELETTGDGYKVGEGLWLEAPEEP